MRSLSAFLKCAIAVATLLLPLAAVAALVEFDIPAQPLDRALLLLSRQAKIELLFSPNAVREMRSIAVVGRREPTEALEQMLHGTGFVARQNFLGKFVVVAAPPPPGTLRGKIVMADGLPARGVRVSLREIRKTALTNSDGEFEFTAVPPAAYHVIASSSGYPTMLVAAEARVESNRVLTLEPQTIRTGS
ncbi:MAG: carboxypeptidase regulatory-like domain-containing protein, partial [Opitutaceae bacterium]